MAKQPIKDDDIVVLDNGNTYESAESTLTAKQYAEQAQLEADRAESNANLAEEAIDTTAAYKDLAKDWAVKTDGKVVEEGVEVDYSSKYYAGKAQEVSALVELARQYYEQLRGLSYLYTPYKLLDSPNVIIDENGLACEYKIVGDTTYTFELNVDPTTNWITFVLKISTHGLETVPAFTFPTNVEWINGTPVLSELEATYILLFVTENFGMTWQAHVEYKYYGN